jgi:beta-lactamase regulating signal transducer with metallopeptidase domain
MHVLIGIALKSLLIAALTLGLLQLLKGRSAAERSWVAHIGLLALVIMAFAPLVLPSWNVEAPAIFGAQVQPAPALAVVAAPAVSPEVTPALGHAPATRPGPAGSPFASLSPSAIVTALYALPAAVLLFITLLALGRLVTLRARADVLVDGHWLSALARAQRRMGFKHGTALLTSNELASPISWGLMRPVILLNSRAVEAADEAEAIIAHELAHVARLDWIKLLLARVATALFWFNPLVWVLAREAHQLREEAADDSVLGADIVDTDYAQLLVGVARHECPGLLLGAHGVAPSKSSLARRVARVLDGKSARGPVARSFALGVFAGAILVAAPLAALTVTPKAVRLANSPAARTLAPSGPSRPAEVASVEPPTDLPHIIASGVSTSVATAVAAVAPVPPPFRIAAPSGATVEGANGMVVARSPNGATVTVYPPDAQGRRKTVVRAPDGTSAVSYAENDPRRAPGFADRRQDGIIEKAIKAKATGVTPEYIAAMRAAVPSLSRLDFADFSGMRTLGVTPDFARELAGAGFPRITADELTQARAVGLTGGYVSAMRGAGVEGNLDDFIQLRAVGVDPSFAARVKASGIRPVRADDLVELRALGISSIPRAPRTPPPPRPPQPDNDPGG